MGRERRCKMAKYRVLVPFVNFSPNVKQYTQGDLYEPADAGEAERMIEKGTLDAVPVQESKKVERAEKIETAEAKPAGVEKAVKRGKEK